jgi:uncharacterized protein
MQRKCPVCNKKVERTLPDGKPNIWFPFCCRRCQMVDLGAWFEGEYRLPQEPDDEKPDQQ